VTLQEYQGFHIFSEIVLFFFDFLVTGGTYDNQTWTKMFRKNFIIVSVTIVLLFRSGASYDEHWQIML